MAALTGDGSSPSAPSTSLGNSDEAAVAATVIWLAAVLASSPSSPIAELPRIEEIREPEPLADAPDPGTPDNLSHAHEPVLVTQREESSQTIDQSLHASPSSPSPQASTRRPRKRPAHISLPAPAFDRPLPSIPSPVVSRNGTRSDSSTRAQRAESLPLTNDLGRMPSLPRAYPGVGAGGRAETLGPIEDSLRSSRYHEAPRPGWWADREAVHDTSDVSRRRSVRVSDDHEGERREPEGGFRANLLRLKQNARGGRAMDREAGPPDDMELENSSTSTQHLNTVQQRLKRTLIDARKERDKAKEQAKWTTYALNGAIGLQVLFGALTTGLGAALSGKSSSAPLAIAILGGGSTILASYLARARGSGEPEKSALRVHSLEHFLRRLEAFCDDVGDKPGDHFKPQIEAFRGELEYLLDNKGDAAASVAAPQGETDAATSYGGTFTHAQSLYPSSGGAISSQPGFSQQPTSTFPPQNPSAAANYTVASSLYSPQAPSHSHQLAGTSATSPLYTPQPAPQFITMPQSTTMPQAALGNHSGGTNRVVASDPGSSAVVPAGTVLYSPSQAIATPNFHPSIFVVPAHPATPNPPTSGSMNTIIASSNAPQNTATAIQSTVAATPTNTFTGATVSTLGVPGIGAIGPALPQGVYLSPPVNSPLGAPGTPADANLYLPTPGVYSNAANAQGTSYFPDALSTVTVTLANAELQAALAQQPVEAGEVQGDPPANTNAASQTQLPENANVDVSTSFNAPL